MPPDLEDEIAKARLEIQADTMAMAVSELTNLYREGVLRIRPEFQRLYRWSEEQKSRLVESILLGIPLPSIFVAQDSETGNWELVDGLQRVSTILELQGLLVDGSGGALQELVLRSTNYLPSLEGHSWSGEGDTQALSDAQKNDIRLSRIDVKVIRRGSDPQAKFDLFQRLNSFGSSLTPQEIRSAMIAGVNSDCLAWLTRLANEPSFGMCIGLSERLLDEQYDLELVLRFLMLHDWPIGEVRSRLSDFAARLNEWALELAARFDGDQARLEEVFVETFKAIAGHGSEDVFRKWDGTTGRFRGAFLNTSFEVIGLGIGFHVAHGTPFRSDIEAAARELWSLDAMSTRFTTGLATQDRLAKTIPLGRRLMASPPERITSQDLVGGLG